MLEDVSLKSKNSMVDKEQRGLQKPWEDGMTFTLRLNVPRCWTRVTVGRSQLAQRSQASDNAG